MGVFFGKSPTLNPKGEEELLQQVSGAHGLGWITAGLGGWRSSGNPVTQLRLESSSAEAMAGNSGTLFGLETVGANLFLGLTEMDGDGIGWPFLHTRHPNRENR